MRFNRAVILMSHWLPECECVTVMVHMYNGNNLHFPTCLWPSCAVLPAPHTSSSYSLQLPIFEHIPMASFELSHTLYTHLFNQNIRIYSLIIGIYYSLRWIILCVVMNCNRLNADMRDRVMTKVLYISWAVGYITCIRVVMILWLSLTNSLMWWLIPTVHKWNME